MVRVHEIAYLGLEAYSPGLLEAMYINNVVIEAAVRLERYYPLICHFWCLL